METYQNRDNIELVKTEMLTGDNVTLVSMWANGLVVEEIDPESDDRYPALNIQCKDDVKRASLGDYVVQHEDGSFNVYPPLAFRAAYTKEFMRNG